MNNNYNDQISQNQNTDFDFYHHQQQQPQIQPQHIITTNNSPDNNNTMIPFSPTPSSEAPVSPPVTRHITGDQVFPHPLLENPILLQPLSPDQPPKFFNQDDFNILRKLLPASETHKWKYIANKVSKSRAKKMNSEFCSAKFHEFFKLPHNKSSNDSNVQYLNNNKSFYDSESQDNYEGILGTSLPYLVHTNPY